MKKITFFIMILVLVFLSSLLTGFNDPYSEYNHSEDGLAADSTQEPPVAYSMFVNDTEVGVVDFAARGLAVYDEVIEKIRKQYPDSVFLEADLYFREVKGYSADPKDVLANAIEKAVQVKTSAYAIVIDGEVVCYLGSKEDCHQVFETVLGLYRNKIDQKEGTQLEEAYIKEDISIEEGSVLYSQVVDVKKAIEIITTGIDQAKEYEVREGDSLWSVAQAHNIGVSELKAANPQIEGETIYPGQKLNLKPVKSLVTVVTKEKAKYTEEIDYQRKIRETDKLYKGQSKVVQKGEKGLKEIEIYIISENGREISREKIGETISKEPVDEIVEKGTKSRPAPPPPPSRKYNPISRNGIEMTPWFGGAEKIFKRGSVAKVTHVDTGFTFYVKRRGGYNHADSEPLTAKDTEILRRIYGGTWSWARKAIIVEVNGKKMAASMNGMPHGGCNIKDNNFPGHICIHFYGSKGHSSGKVDPDHQAMIRHAMGLD